MQLFLFTFSCLLFEVYFVGIQPWLWCPWGIAEHVPKLLWPQQTRYLICHTFWLSKSSRALKSFQSNLINALYPADAQQIRCFLNTFKLSSSSTVRCSEKWDLKRRKVLTLLWDRKSISSCWCQFVIADLAKKDVDPVAIRWKSLSVPRHPPTQYKFQIRFPQLSPGGSYFGVSYIGLRLSRWRSTLLLCISLLRKFNFFTLWWFHSNSP